MANYNIFTIGSLQPLRENYSPIAIGDIGTVSDEEWAEHWRVHGSGWRNPDPNNVQYLERAYGGSDMGIISDTSNFDAKLSLWATKSGVNKAINRKKSNDSLELGHLYETVTAQKYHNIMRRSGKKHLKVLVEGKVFDESGKLVLDKNGKPFENRTSMYMYRDGRKNADGSFKYPWALANCDAFVVDDGVQGGLEIKTTSARNTKIINEEWKEGIIPIYYLYQIVYYMAILNLQFWDICCSWGQPYEDTAIIRFYRDYDLEQKVFEMVSEFDEYVEQGIEPDPSTCRGDLLNDYYYQLFGPVEEDAPFIELPEKFRGAVNRAIAVDKEIEELEKKLKEKELEREKTYAELYPVMKTSSYAQFRLDDKNVVGITLKTPMHKAKFDEDKFRAEHPDIYDTYQKFDLTEFGKKEKKLKKDYMLPAEPNLEGHPSFSIKFYDRPLKV